MKKLIIILLIGILVSCKINYSLFGSYRQNYNKMYSVEQFDSICTVDTLDNLNNWEKLSVIDNETNQIITEYLFLKKNIVYRAIQTGDSIKLTKRINK